MHGTRGWNLNCLNEEKSILDREALRLELSITSGIKEYGKDKPIIVCMHYPPTTKDLLENSIFIEIMQKYNVQKCIYGHLHGESLNEEVIEGKIGKINIELVSSDYLDFKLKTI